MAEAGANHYYDRLQTQLPQLRSCVEIFDELLHMTGSAYRSKDHFVFRVLVSLLAKIRDDLQALLTLTLDGHTSASFAVARSILESSLDILYLAGVGEDERASLARKFFFYSIAEKKRQGLLHANLDPRAPGSLGQMTDDELRRRAVRDAMAEVLKVEYLKELQAIGEEWAKLPRSWAGKGVSGKLSLVREASSHWSLPGSMYTVDVSLSVVYAAASGFVHSSDALFYSQELGEPDGPPEGFILKRGPIEELHYAPPVMALDLVSVVLFVFNETFDLGLTGSVKKGVSRCREMMDWLEPPVSDEDDAT